MLLKSNIPVMYYFLLFRFLRYNATKTSRIFLEERKPFLLKFRFLCRYLKTYFEQLNKRQAFKIGEKIDRKQIIIIKKQTFLVFFSTSVAFFFRHNTNPFLISPFVLHPGKYACWRCWWRWMRTCMTSAGRHKGVCHSHPYRRYGVAIGA